jgi:hypothetical protein
MELIPQKLRRAHEDCEVIFFCGAGVSMPAGLPSFGELVENVLSDLLPAANQCKAGSVEALAWKALENYKYDEAIEILESADQGGYERRSVRARVHFHLTKQKTKLLESHVILARLADLDTDTRSLRMETTRPSRRPKKRRSKNGD